MNNNKTEGVMNPVAERLILAVKVLIARVIFHKGTKTLLSNEVIGEYTELLKALIAATGQDSFDVIQEINKMTKAIEEDKNNNEKEILLRELDNLLGKTRDGLQFVSISSTL